MYILSDDHVEAGRHHLKALRGEGMPRQRLPDDFGDLFFVFNVLFPSRLPDDVRPRVRALLAPLASPAPSASPCASAPNEVGARAADDYEVRVLEDLCPIASLAAAAAASREAGCCVEDADTDADDTDRRDGEGVSCVQQ